MPPTGYDRTQLKLLLQTSQGFPAQSPSSKAKVTAGQLRPAREGHPLSQHLSGAGVTSYKTKFCSLDAMADALALVLQSADGAQALQTLAPAVRKTVKVEVPGAFEIEAELQWTPPLKVKFNRTDLALAGRTTTRCVAVLEGRLRDGRTHLHVQTFYPELAPAEIEALIDKKTTP